jgi:hypothetical protein
MFNKILPMKNKKIFLLFIFFLFFNNSYSSMIFYSINQDSMFLGDPINFKIITIVPKGSNIVPPSTENDFGKFTVKNWNTSKKEKSNADSITFDYIITTYSTENCTIPSLSFAVLKEQIAETLKTQPIAMRIITFSPPDTATIKDIKPQLSAGKPSMWFLWLILILILGFISYFLLKNHILRKKEKPIIVPPLPPHEEALKALSELEAKQYLLKGMIREYVFELSEILKRYIERRFEVNAAEFTTQEILEWIKVSNLELEDKKSLEWFFDITDPVKFAKWIPDNDIIYRLLPCVRDFINRTKPQITTTQSESVNKNSISNLNQSDNLSSLKTNKEK